MPYLTPETIPTTDFICRRLVIPNDIDIIGAVNGALDELCQPQFWQQFGAVTPEEIAAAMNTMFNSYADSTETCP